MKHKYCLQIQREICMDEMEKVRNQSNKICHSVANIVPRGQTRLRGIHEMTMNEWSHGLRRILRPIRKRLREFLIGDVIYMTNFRIRFLIVPTCYKKSTEACTNHLDK